MKTNLISSASSFILALMIFILGNNNLRGQQLDLQSPVINSNPSEEGYEINSFTARNVEGNIYFQVTVQNDTVDGIFVLEKSVDGVNFNHVDAKSNIPNKINKPVLYCFKDKTPTTNAKYRMMKYTSKEEYYLADYHYEASPDANERSEEEMMAESLPEEP